MLRVGDGQQAEVRPVGRNPNLQRLGKGQKGRAGVPEDGDRSRPRGRMGSERRDRVVRGLQMGEILRGGWCPGRAGGRSAGSGLGRPCEVLGGVLKVSKEGGPGSRA